MSKLLLICSLFMVGLTTCTQNTPEKTEGRERVDTVAAINEPILPISHHAELNEEKVALGNTLFHDPRLSHNNTISCAHCHALQTGGVDGTPHSFGINGAEGTLNSPTVFNSGLNFRQFWDGRAASLEEQIEGPTHALNEMGSNWEDIIDKLSDMPNYVFDFDALYADGITRENIKDAIAIFERSLNTPNSRFDQYLLGDESAITEEEKQGYTLFKSLGCVSCHQGASVGGNLYQKFGVMGEYFTDRDGDIIEADMGRFNVTGKEEDRYVFKVPSLRLAVLTAPYFHDGSIETLEETISIMGEYQLKRSLSDDEISLLIAFLNTLPGEYNGVSLVSQPSHGE